MFHITIFLGYCASWSQYLWSHACLDCLMSQSQMHIFHKIVNLCTSLYWVSVSEPSLMYSYPLPQDTVCICMFVWKRWSHWSQKCLHTLIHSCAQTWPVFLAKATETGITLHLLSYYTRGSTEGHSSVLGHLRTPHFKDVAKLRCSECNCNKIPMPTTQQLWRRFEGLPA